VHRELGRGYSGPAVVGDTVYILGTVGQEEAVIALDLATGRRRWTTPLGPIFENPWGNGPRSTPTIDGQRLYALTPAGRLAALSLDEGKLLWSRELESDFDGEAPFWGYSESPLVDGDRLVVTPGLANTLVALDKRTGDLIWKSSGLDDGAQYSSIVAAQAGGQAIYLTMTDRGLVGVSARTGALVLRDERTKNGTAHCTIPLVHGGHVYTTSGFGAGCALLQLGAEPKEVYASSLMKNQHGGVVLVDGSVFGYSDGAGWLCHDFLSGELRWSDKESLPKGSLIAADGRLYCLSEKDGTVALLEPSAAGWREHGRLSLPEAPRLARGKGGVWTHPVVSHGRLFIRDQELLFAFDIAGAK
jgi:outer membrane protein assembly factor BamB